MKMKYPGRLQGHSLLMALLVAGAVGGTGAAVAAAKAKPLAGSRNRP
jgi:hypothetical protein